MAIEKKYTLEFVIKEVENLLSELKSNKNIVYIGELFEDKDYTRQRYNEWISKPTGDKEDRVSRYGDNQDLLSMSSAIKEILESRAITGAMNNKLNATSTIFHLKNNYKWVDKQEINQTNKNLDYQVEDTEEMQELLKNNDLI